MPLFGTGDVVGCGFDYDERTAEIRIYFTKNGTLVGMSVFLNVGII